MTLHQPGKGAEVFRVDVCNLLGLEWRNSSHDVKSPEWCPCLWQPLPLGIYTFHFEGEYSVKKCKEPNSQPLPFHKSKMPVFALGGNLTFPGLRRSLLSLSELYMVNQAKVVTRFGPTSGFAWIRNNTVQVACFWWVEGPSDHVLKAAVCFLGNPVMVCFLKVDPDCNVILFYIACHASIYLSSRSRILCIYLDLFL